MKRTEQAVIAKKWWSSLSLNEQKEFKIKHLGKDFPNCSVYTKSGDNIITIWQGEGNPIPETIIKFSDGEYIIRPDGIGDSVIGSKAHEAMWAMARKLGYTTIVPTEERVKFIEDYKTQNA